MRIGGDTFVAVVCGTLLAGACGPRAFLDTGETGTSLLGESAQPNARRYRDSSSRPGTGRSGSAAIEVRAYVDLSGQMRLEITTGSFDGSRDPVGTITKVQLQVADAPARNFTGLVNGGFVSIGLPGLTDGSELQVQVNVRSVDGNRTDVVTASTKAVLAPDLVVSQVVLPERAFVSTPVPIAASVQELNGDLGARADCVLVVDGSEADRAPGIWVDAGGQVSCAFEHAFDEIGIHEVEVRLDGVSPADYDPSNNAARGTIAIVEPIRATYSATVYEYDYTSNVHTERTGPDGTVLLREDSGSRGWSNSMVFSLQIARGLTFPIDRISFADATDGTPLGAVSFTDVMPTAPYASGGLVGECTSRFEGPTFMSVCVLRRVDAQEPHVTSITASRYSGEITYFGTRIIPSPSYTWNYTNRFGLTPRYGARYSASIVVEHGDRALNGSLDFAFATETLDPTPVERCSPVAGGGETCTTSILTGTRIRGGQAVQQQF